jgi:hypothetical protein
MQSGSISGSGRPKQKAAGPKRRGDHKQGRSISRTAGAYTRLLLPFFNFPRSLNLFHHGNVI